MINLLGKRIYKKEEGVNEYKSWYDLSYEDAYQLEQEFISHDMGNNANRAMHICIILGIFTITVTFLVLLFMILRCCINPYIFTLITIFLLLGIIIIVGSNIEYHMKFNSWLRFSKKIIKK